MLASTTASEAPLIAEAFFGIPAGERKESSVVFGGAQNNLNLQGEMGYARLSAAIT